MDEKLPPWGTSFAEISSLVATERHALGVLYVAEERVVQALLVLGREGGGLVAVPAGSLEGSEALGEEASLENMAA